MEEIRRFVTQTVNWKLRCLSAILFIFFVSLSAQAQTKTTAATKFDEFKYANLNDKDARLSRFSAEIKKHYGARGYVVVYGARAHEPYKNLADDIARHVVGDLVWTIKNPISQKRITSINGGLRDDVTVELYIALPGASAPVPVPAYKPEQEIRCPQKPYIYGPSYLGSVDEEIVLKASIAEPRLTDPDEIKWSLSTGTIISGQGTNSIRIRMSGPAYNPFTATVKISGYPPECNTEQSYSSPERIATFPLKVADLRGDCEIDWAMLDFVLGLLYEKPDLKLYMIYYGGPTRYTQSGIRRGESEALAEAKVAYLTGTKHLEPTRFVMINGGYREKWAMELWLIDKTGTVPVATPTVQPKDMKFANGPIRFGLKCPCCDIGYLHRTPTDSTGDERLVRSSLGGVFVEEEF